MLDQFEHSLSIGLTKDLKGNRLAGVLYDLAKSGKLYVSSPERLIAELLSGKVSLKGTVPEVPVILPGKVTDMRFLYLALKNIKKFPEAREGRYYGIRFSENEIPVSTVLLGSNGVGKTSLYSSLEFVGMRKANTAAIRGYERKIGTDFDERGKLSPDQSFFLDHGQKGMADSRIIVKTMSQDLVYETKESFHSSESPLVCDAFYCSEYDVRWLETCDDLSGFFIKQIGYERFYSSLQLLYYLGASLRKRKAEIQAWILENGEAEWDEYLERFKLGMVYGGVKWVPPGNVHTNLVELIDSISGESDRVRRKSFIIRLRNILRSELKRFNQSSWFTEGVRMAYIEALRVLHSIDTETANGEWPKGDSIRRLGRFNSWRIRLLSYVLSRNVDTSEWQRIEQEEGKGMALYFDSKVKAEQNEKMRKDLIDITQLENKDRFWKDYLQLVRYLEDSLKSLLESWSMPICETVKALLSDYFRIDNDEIKVDIKFLPSLELENLNLGDGVKESDIVRNFIEFDIKIMSSEGDLKRENRRPVHPRAYLNTFKYKLFCVALKLAFTCVAKKVYGINYPFIIDDVFDSSDFDNRLKLRDFVRNMRECHDAILPGDDYSLQFIFFTQDDLIADQFDKGIISGNPEEKTRFVRIYDYHESEDSDLCSFTYTDKSGKEVGCDYVALDESLSNSNGKSGTD